MTCSKLQNISGVRAGHLLRACCSFLSAWIAFAILCLKPLAYHEFKQTMTEKSGFARVGLELRVEDGDFSALPIRKRGSAERTEPSHYAESGNINTSLPIHR